MLQDHCFRDLNLCDFSRSGMTLNCLYSTTNKYPLWAHLLLLQIHLSILILLWQDGLNLLAYTSIFPSPFPPVCCHYLSHRLSNQPTFSACTHTYYQSIYYACRQSATICIHIHLVWREPITDQKAIQCWDCCKVVAVADGLLVVWKTDWYDHIAS